MISNVTKQDFMAVTTDARNKIIERLVTKYDVQAAADSARDRIQADLNAMHLENQSLMRQSNATRDQLWRKVSALEGQITSLQQEIRTLTQTITKMSDQMQQTT